eukprot:CAMPEP_0198525114 /NCGR_PEP_ID=MMETSP1462-20131121/23155_1 /TAXON_ID=1333877 /ORGANISM="Brandtodinium nutriculum, Strain RCC3387" /LENGTH=236 /DNA_ID=CAMNT_0044254859 /DNA_START=62 /DNA_END=769 /DNA_ORIENTATION=+
MTPWLWRGGRGGRQSPLFPAFAHPTTVELGDYQPAAPAGVAATLVRLSFPVLAFMLAEVCICFMVWGLGEWILARAGNVAAVVLLRYSSVGAVFMSLVRCSSLACRFRTSLEFLLRIWTLATCMLVVYLSAACFGVIVVVFQEFNGDAFGTAMLLFWLGNIAIVMLLIASSLQVVMSQTDVAEVSLPNHHAFMTVGPVEQAFCPQCMVCLSNFESNDMVVVLPCRHTLHKECAQSW